MIRGTTPDYTLSVEDRDLTDKTVFVTIKQIGKEITLTGNRLGIEYSEATETEPAASTIAFGLTQSETLFFAEGTADVQVRFIGADGYSGATNKGKINIGPVLYEKEIEYGGE